MMLHSLVLYAYINLFANIYLGLYSFLLKGIYCWKFSHIISSSYQTPICYFGLVSVRAKTKEEKKRVLPDFYQMAEESNFEHMKKM